MTRTSTSTTFDLVEADAAESRRRVDEHRPTDDSSPQRSRRVAGVAAALTLVAAVALFGVDTAGGEATAQTFDDTASTPVQQGYEQGRPDGWYESGRTPTTNAVPGTVR